MVSARVSPGPGGTAIAGTAAGASAIAGAAAGASSSAMFLCVVVAEVMLDCVTDRHLGVTGLTGEFDLASHHPGTVRYRAIRRCFS